MKEGYVALSGVVRQHLLYHHIYSDSVDLAGTFNSTEKVLYVRPERLRVLYRIPNWIPDQQLAAYIERKI